MAHPYKHAAHKSDPKWLGGVRKYAEGGGIPTDPNTDKYQEGRSGPAYSKGSSGALTEAMKYAQKTRDIHDPTQNYGQGPSIKAVEQKEVSRGIQPWPSNVWPTPQDKE